jgi:hypothetical protein
MILVYCKLWLPELKIDLDTQYTHALLWSLTHSFSHMIQNCDKAYGSMPKLESRLGNETRHILSYDCTRT